MEALAAKREDSPGDVGGNALSPISSRYSSCGESEFDRYCSANSMVATPSFCGSSFTDFSDCNEDEFGSVRSVGSFEGLSFGGRFEPGGEIRKLSAPSVVRRPGERGVDSGELRFMTGVDNAVNRLSLFGDDHGDCSYLEEVGDCDDGGDEMGLRKMVDLSAMTDEGLFNGGGDGGLRSAGSSHHFSSDNEASRYRSELEFEIRNDVVEHEMVVNVADEWDGMQHGGLSEEEEETWSRDEYSGGEDSGFEDGVDGEENIGPQNWSVQRNKEKGEPQNPFRMGASVAYGGDDWDDFSEQNGEEFMTSMAVDNLQPRNGIAANSRDNPSETFSENEVARLGPDICEVGTDMSTSSCHVLEADESENYPDSHSANFNVSESTSTSETSETIKDIHLDSYQLQEPGLLTSCQSFHLTSNSLTRPELKEDYKLLTKDNDRCGDLVKEFPSTFPKDSVLKGQTESELDLDPLSSTTKNPLYLPRVDALKEDESKPFGHESKHSMSMVMDERSSNNPFVSASTCEDNVKLVKMEAPELNESLDDFVTEMEEILLSSAESPGLRFNPGSNMFQSQISLPSRGTESAASTSGRDAMDSAVHHILKIDGVEVIGAKQKKGDVSLGERLVGVKEYTVYKIRVWSGNDRWEVERRYRDFCTLHRRLKSYYADRGVALPSPWSSVERESRKVFGNASPDVVAERSILIQECLTSVFNSRFSSNSPGALIWFLSPQDSFISSPRAVLSGTEDSSTETNTQNNGSLGRTISLIVENRRVNSVKQQLEAQHYKCAGCHQHFDDGKTIMLEIIYTLGWGKPRLCEYTGQLYCHSCHTNDTAVLPSRVLHHWDFTDYPVSQMAKSYLDSINDQPMLCVSAVNPFLLSKVPALLHVMNIRKKVGAMLPYVRCPFRRSINKGLGSRRYLLESSDFFSLRDLVDLSRGPFAALPVAIETVTRKILEHITEQCLLCCDVGVVCGAKQACRDPMSLIFPFQESKVKKCGSCGLVFHDSCFKKLTNCPCEAPHRLDKAPESVHRVGSGANSEAGALDVVGQKIASSFSVGLISSLFSKTTELDRLGRQNSNNNVILMGSMPCDSI